MACIDETATRDAAAEHAHRAAGVLEQEVHAHDVLAQRAFERLDAVSQDRCRPPATASADHVGRHVQPAGGLLGPGDQVPNATLVQPVGDLVADRPPASSASACNDSTTRWSFSSVRPEISTWAPSRTRTPAVALPMAPPPAVITALFPASGSGRSVIFAPLGRAWADIFQEIAAACSIERLAMLRFGVSCRRGTRSGGRAAPTVWHPRSGGDRESVTTGLAPLGRPPPVVGCRRLPGVRRSRVRRVQHARRRPARRSGPLSSCRVPGWPPGPSPLTARMTPTAPMARASRPGGRCAPSSSTSAGWPAPRHRPAPGRARPAPCRGRSPRPGDEPQGMRVLSGLPAVVGRAVLVYPRGVGLSWNAGACCAAARAAQVDDVGFIRALVKRVLSTQVDANPRAVYVVGFSNGGRMAYRLACAAPRLFAGVAAVEAVPVAGCLRAPPIPVLAVAAADDPMLSIDWRQPRHSVEGYVEPRVSEAVATWRRLDRCGATGTVRRWGPVQVTTWARCAAATRVGLALYPPVATAGPGRWPARRPSGSSGPSCVAPRCRRRERLPGPRAGAGGPARR